MNASTLSRDPFMPRAPKVRGRAIALAVAAHVLLIVGLMFSVNWGSEEPATVAAELWSATPQAAAPRAVEPPPQPEVKKVEPVVKPTPKPPEPVVAAKPPTPALPDPQIAIEKAKKEDAKRVAAEQESLKKQKREKAERKKEELALKKEKADKLKADQARAEHAKNEKAEKAEAARLASIRDAQMKRMAGLAGATGGATDTGTALRSSAPSANYAGRVMARIKPNILLTDPVDGNPRAVVEVKLAPDGTIIAKRLVQSSGVKVWDDAVLRAIERTEMLPLDNGRAPPVFEIGFRPRD
jgi:colicin import membrane protein